MTSRRRLIFLKHRCAHSALTEFLMEYLHEPRYRAGWQRVADTLRFTGGGDDSCFSQDGQVLRQGRLAERHALVNLAD